jgi:hypothetical protein
MPEEAPTEQAPDTRVTHIIWVVLQELFQDPFWLFVVIAFPALIDWSLYILFGTETGGLFFIPWLIPIFFYTIVSDRVRARFWKEVSKSKGWVYEGKVSLMNEEALFLNQGLDRVMQNQIVGHHKELPVRVFESAYTIGEGKNSTTYKNTAYAFHYTGTFPHCYLNRRNNAHNFAPAGASKVPLPSAFEDVFELYVPKEYEIEALEIFTPDVLQHLLDTDWPHDIEFVDSELIVFRTGWLNTLPKFETEFAQASTLADYLTKTLGTVHFTKIGTMPYLLKDVSPAASLWTLDLEQLPQAYGYLLISMLTLVTTVFLYQIVPDPIVVYLTFAIGALFAILYAARNNE